MMKHLSAPTFGVDPLFGGLIAIDLKGFVVEAKGKSC
jgi:hypothetical protein